MGVLEGLCTCRGREYRGTVASALLPSEPKTALKIKCIHCFKKQRRKITQNSSVPDYFTRYVTIT